MGMSRKVEYSNKILKILAEKPAVSVSELIKKANPSQPPLIKGGEKNPPDKGDIGGFYSRAYLAHLFHNKEMLGATLASIHNLYFIVNLVKKIRQSILDDNFFEFKEEFLKNYLK